MNKISCVRCEKDFYSAARESHLPCPYCGYLMKVNEPDRRNGDRTVSQRTCDILKGEVCVPVKTVDISETGMGIKMLGYLPFDQNETVDICIKELEIEKRAQIVWVRNFYGISRAGLRFIPEHAC